MKLRVSEYTYDTALYARCPDNAVVYCSKGSDRIRDQRNFTKPAGLCLRSHHGDTVTGSPCGHGAVCTYLGVRVRMEDTSAVSWQPR